MDIKKVLTSNSFTLPTTMVATFLLTLALCGRNPEEKAKEKFADKQEASVYTTDNKTGERVENREYFEPSTFKTVDWATMSNSEIGKLLGEISAKELALDIDSINRKLVTPGKIYGLDYNYCNKSITKAIVDATKRMKFRKNCYAGRPFAKSTGRNAALYNGDRLVEYFAKDSISGAVINDPTEEELRRVNPGAVVRFPGHSKMFIGIGFVNSEGTVFVPDTLGRPVIASGYNERFSYYSGGNCTVVDIAKVVEYNLTKAGRQR